MKKKMLSALLCIALFASNSIHTAAATHYEFNTIYTVESTAYCDTGLTATQTIVNENTKRYVCAFAPEYFGCIIQVTTDFDGDGQKETRLYECEDTGSVSAGVRTGDVLDLFMPEGKEACYEYGRRQVEIVIYKGGVG